MQNNFREIIDAGEWHALVENRSPFLAHAWEGTLIEAFPYLRFRYFLYRNDYAVRFAEINGRLTTTPFSDGGDVVSLRGIQIPLSDFKSDVLACFGNSITLRVHEYFCPVTQSEGSETDITDFQVALADFDIGALRKTLRHIVEEKLPAGASIRAMVPSDLEAVYQLYLRTMRGARALALPLDAFKRFSQEDVFVFVVDGIVRGASVFCSSGKHVHYFISALDAVGKKHRAAHHLLFYALGHYKQQGKEYAFLGGANNASALKVFKEGWRGIPHPLYTITAAATRKRAQRSGLRTLWRCIPLSLLPKTSKFIGKYVL
ncbi:MAG: hypothetical protein KBD16_01950 [Candidatus Pacebacteria bacterium]|nr:hypothetical protein [Candidatus Paceibacterota bacterium]